MAFSWIRGNVVGNTASDRFAATLAPVPTGATLVRTIFGWSAYVQVPMWQYELVVGRAILFGVDTVRSGFGGTIPHPGQNPLTELSYPSQRWLWYEHAPLVSDGATRWHDAGTHITMRTEGTATMRQCETQVINIFAAQTLNVMVSFESTDLLPLGLEFTCVANMSALYSLLWPARGFGRPTSPRGSWRTP